MYLVVLQMAVMAKCSARGDYVIALLHEENRFMGPRHLILPENQTAVIQVY